MPTVIKIPKVSQMTIPLKKKKTVSVVLKTLKEYTDDNNIWVSADLSRVAID